MIELSPSLIQKMRIKEGNLLLILDNGKEYKTNPVTGIDFTNQISKADGILLFVNSSATLKTSFLKIVKSFREDCLLWIAYPKKSSSIKTDLDRDHGWDVLSENGYEGVALVSFNETWSAVRFRKTEAVKKGGSKAEKQKRPELAKYIDYDQKIVKLPEDVKKAFSKNKKAKVFFELLSWSHKRKYIEPILEAKALETRASRVQKMIYQLNSTKPKLKKSALKKTKRK
ncbi:YdeI family protein [Leptospira sp. WS92.C1]